MLESRLPHVPTFIEPRPARGPEQLLPAETHVNRPWATGEASPQHRAPPLPPQLLPISQGPPGPPCIEEETESGMDPRLPRQAGVGCRPGVWSLPPPWPLLGAMWRWEWGLGSSLWTPPPAQLSLGEPSLPVPPRPVAAGAAPGNVTVTVRTARLQKRWFS